MLSLSLSLFLSRHLFVCASEAALAPAAVANGERQEKTQKEGQEDQEAKATRQEAEEGPRLEAQAQSEKKRSPRSERSPARERDEGSGSDLSRLCLRSTLRSVPEVRGARSVPGAIAAAEAAAAIAGHPMAVALARCREAPGTVSSEAARRGAAGRGQRGRISVG